MSPAVEETPNADGSVRNIVSGEEGIPQDFPTSSATPSAMRSKKEGDDAEDPCHKHPHGQRACSLTWEPKGKNNKGKTQENSYEAMSLVPTSFNGKMSENIKDANGTAQVMNSWKVRITLKESTRGRHWKRRSRKAQRNKWKDSFEPYDEESTTPFTRRINKFVFPK
nr:hypothetical protein [Tanacetum cinerariifolium]